MCADITYKSVLVDYLHENISTCILANKQDQQGMAVFNERNPTLPWNNYKNQ
jgi:hypothetical protein